MMRRSWWVVSNRLESALLRHFGTSGVALIGRRSVLILETTGRRTGRARRTPLAYWRADGALFVGGGAAGMPRADWVANLRAQPAAAVWVGRRRFPVLATELTGAVADRARRHAVELWPEVARYGRLSGRPIPYFRLDPV